MFLRRSRKTAGGQPAPEENTVRREKSQFLVYSPTKEDVGECLCCGEKCKYNPVHHPFDLLNEKVTKLVEKVKGERLPNIEKKGPDAGAHPGSAAACLPHSPIFPKLMSSSTPNLGAGGKQAVSTIDPGSRSMCTLGDLH